MNRAMNKLEELIVERAANILAWDDCHPEVGMGMFCDTAVDKAIKALTNEAKVWGATIKPEMWDRNTVLENLRERRRSRW